MGGRRDLRPHIGAIYGLEDIDAETALVLELLEGPTLAERLDRGSLTMVEALAVARQVADARVKVLDFGLATTGIGEHETDPDHVSMTDRRTEAGRILSNIDLERMTRLSGMPYDGADARRELALLESDYTDTVTRHRPLLVLVILSFAGVSCRALSAPPATVANPTATARQAWLEEFARGYFPGRSGQVFLIPHEGDFIVDRSNPLYAFMHGSPWDYDTHIPLLFHGPPFIKQGVWNDPVTQQDVAPTLAALLGTVPPATAVGRPLRQALAATTARPRIVALFVLDGARSDYFDTYAGVMPTLSRLRREGAWFSNAHVTSVPTLTAVGHANLGTGAEPRVHGLAVNNLFNRVTGKPQEAYNGLDPGEMMALTLADVWNIETEGRAIIIGQGGAIRATAGLVGHGACVLNGRRVLAASYSTRDAGWETNPICYAMSEALKPINARTYWEEVDGKWMGHDISDATTFRHSAVFQRFEGDALAAVLEREPIGADEVTDLVLVNLKGPDYVGHAYGPASAEMKEELTELDRQIARALAIIVRKAGEGRFVVTFSADHGMPDEPRPGGRHYMDDISALVDKRFTPSGGTVVQYFNDAANNEMHLDTSKLRTLGFSLKDVATFLESQGFLSAVFTEDEVRIAQSRLALRAQ